jgi:aryl-alcohol dehydrogenase-like predicted oxidoreductase
VTFGREIDEAAAGAVMNYAAGEGWTMFDTAAAYGGGASERIVGAWLQRRPASLRPLLATKILPPYEPATLRSRVDASLQRLGLARVDVLYLHQWHESALQPDTLAALHGAVADGLVGALGASNFNADQLGRALTLQAERGFAPFRYLQNIHNYAVSAFDAPLVSLCLRAGVERVGYSPLGAGFLTGKYDGGVPPGTRFDLIPGHQAIYFTAAARERLARLHAVAREMDCTPAELALAWAARHPALSRVLIGGRSPSQVAQGPAALARVPAEVTERLD